MQWQTAYFDLCEEIEAWELRVKDLEYELKLAHRACFSGVASGGGMGRIPLDKALEHHDSAKERLLNALSILEHKKATRIEMDAHMEKFQGLSYQVAYRRDIGKQSLQQIASDLGYSYNWIMKVSSNVPRYKGRNKAEPA